MHTHTHTHTHIHAHMHNCVTMETHKYMYAHRHMHSHAQMHPCINLCHEAYVHDIPNYNLLNAHHARPFPTLLSTCLTAALLHNLSQNFLQKFRAIQVKNKAPAERQITVEHILRESKEIQLEVCLSLLCVLVHILASINHLG